MSYSFKSLPRINLKKLICFLVIHLDSSALSLWEELRFLDKISSSCVHLEDLELRINIQKIWGTVHLKKITLNYGSYEIDLSYYDNRSFYILSMALNCSIWGVNRRRENLDQWKNLFWKLMVIQIHWSILLFDGNHGHSWLWRCASYHTDRKNYLRDSHACFLWYFCLFHEYNRTYLREF